MQKLVIGLVMVVATYSLSSSGRPHFNMAIPDARLYLAELEKMCTIDSMYAIDILSKKGYILSGRDEYLLFSHANASNSTFSDASALKWKPCYANNRGLSTDEEPTWNVQYSYYDLVHSAALQTSIIKSKKYKRKGKSGPGEKEPFYNIIYENEDFVISLDVAQKQLYTQPGAGKGRTFVFKIRRR